MDRNEAAQQAIRLKRQPLYCWVKSKRKPKNATSWHSSAKRRPPVPWYGGKYLLAPKIVREFPDHHAYLEPFGGGGSVLLNKQPSGVETYNDLDKRITRLFRVLRDHGHGFRKRLQLTPYSEVEFQDAAEYPPDATDIDRAVADFVRFRQSFSAAGANWSFARTRANGGMASNVHSWWSAIDGLPEVIARLKRVQITCQPAIKAIERFDAPDTLIYCDPPYLPETRAKGSRKVYSVEMTRDDHIALAEVLNRCKGKVIISGYPSRLYDDLYAGWRTKHFSVAKHGEKGSKKSRATECLWMNF